MISGNSWEAESSGGTLTDNATATFKGLVDKFTTVHRPRSLIVLAHDTSAPNVSKVGKDIAHMESYAKSHGVRIEYYATSQLYAQLQGEEP